VDRSTFLTGKPGVSEKEIKKRYKRVFPILISCLVLGILGIIFSAIGYYIFSFWFTLIISIFFILSMTTIIFAYFFLK
jgi:hypothetical protein